MESRTRPVSPAAGIVAVHWAVADRPTFSLARGARILAWENGADGSGAESLHMKGGGSLNPSTHETLDADLHYLYQDGKIVFKEAVKGMANISQCVLDKAGLTADDLTGFKNENRRRPQCEASLAVEPLLLCSQR